MSHAQQHPDGTRPTMWKGASDHLVLTDEVNATRTDLIAGFMRDPLARHDIELQMLVSGVRGSARLPRIALARTGDGRWTVVEVSAVRGAAPVLATPRIFDDLREAERFVFDLRLRMLDRLNAQVAR